jgi:hypothetical protein
VIAHAIEAFHGQPQHAVDETQFAREPTSSTRDGHLMNYQ